MERLGALVIRWNRSINLIARSTESAIWRRHIVDSSQLHSYAPDAHIWTDLGAGGGFPGLVIATMAMESGTPARTILVESDRRKVAFLRAAIRELMLPAEVRVGRIEQLDPIGADIVSARALAPLGRLLGHAERHLRPGGRALFLKGATWRAEKRDALASWSFRCETFPSVTDKEAAVLRIGDIRHG